MAYDLVWLPIYLVLTFNPAIKYSSIMLLFISENIEHIYLPRGAQVVVTTIYECIIINSNFQCIIVKKHKTKPVGRMVTVLPKLTRLWIVGHITGPVM
jgi:hypothetical protein